MVFEKVRHTSSVRGSIPHHERKIKYLQLCLTVRPEVSKGERDFLQSRQFSYSINLAAPAASG